MVACFLSSISAKYYKNPSMLSRVIAKNVGDVFLRHSVDPWHGSLGKGNSQWQSVTSIVQKITFTPIWPTFM